MRFISSAECDQSILLLDEYLVSYYRIVNRSACRPSYRAVVKFVLYEYKLKLLGNNSYEIKFNEAFWITFRAASHEHIHCMLRPY
jgi:hypothetical protein